MSKRIALRATGPGDETFLFQVFLDARREAFAAAGWDGPTLEAFLRDQYWLQDRHYRAVFPEASFAVIEVDGVAAGRLYVDRAAPAIHILDIALLPEYRGQGIGGELLEDLAREADAGGRPLSLMVEVDNRAAGLYRRMGFLDQGGSRDGIYQGLTRPAQRREAVPGPGRRVS